MYICGGITYPIIYIELVSVSGHIPKDERHRQTRVASGFVEPSLKESGLNFMYIPR